jgi:predicted transcriptional regulator of viral defense system
MPKKSQASTRFSQLASLGEVVFHISDLASLWKIYDKNTLHTTLTRYTKQGLLFRLWRGFYAIKPPKDIDPLLLGVKALHRFCYISTETILFREGIISQKPRAITLVSSVSRRFSLLGREYISRQLADEYLHQEKGVVLRGSIREATPERAVADLLYYNPSSHLDGYINWQEVRNLQKAIGYTNIR